MSIYARRARILVVAVGVVALVAGCGSNAADVKPLTKSNFAEKVGAATSSKKSAHIESTIKAGVSEMSIEGDVSYAESGTAAEIVMKQGQSSAGEMRLVDGHTYMSLPPLVPEGKFFEVTQDNKALGSIIKMMDGIGPKQAVDQLDKGLVKLKYVGKKKIGNTQTYHYVVTTDPKKMADTSQLTDELKSELKITTYDVYLNSDYTIRRTRVVASGSEITMNYSGWGKKVTVEAPDKAAIVPAPDFGGLS